MDVMLSNTGTGRVIIKGGGHGKRFVRRLHCGFREPGHKSLVVTR